MVLKGDYEASGYTSISRSGMAPGILEVTFSRELNRKDVSDERWIDLKI